MKILPVDKIREADVYTIKYEPVAGIDLMERAATACFYWLIQNIPHKKKIKIFCGTGNNGGDGLAIARLMSSKGYSVEIYLLGDTEKLSPDCRTNYQRTLDQHTINLHFLAETDQLPAISDTEDIVIDAIFGSGLTRPVTGFYASVIEHLNAGKAICIAIDIPSGLFCDETVYSINNPAIIHADYTLTFAPPKIAFFFPENDKYIGVWHLLEIGILQKFIDQTDSQNFFIEAGDCRKILKKRNKYSHKGTYGHAFLICGSKGKMGASVLAAKSCLRAGPGLVTAHVPSSGVSILQTAVPEAMVDVDPSPDILSVIPELSKFSSIGIGPGIGMESQTAKTLKLLIQNSSIPLIVDADAINILSENKTWIPFIPKGSIFTPHPKEFERLAGKSLNDFDRNKMQREFSVKHDVYIVLKGAHTAITTPEGICFFNSTGNPGMATGGSGDVLTGILTGLKAQGYSSLETCILGVYLHGLAGDHASRLLGQEAMIASDIINGLGKAFLTLY
ncbi:MAG: NAD(P)H-hydrate dehydratase [Bacteroidetes bacterium]|nr:NAD(P)H-hydrate dehydratase [Bacteroidota bacterium]